MGRGFRVVHLKSGTVDVARVHAIQIVWVGRHLVVFSGESIQAWLMQFPEVMYCINMIHSFSDLPASITFLVGLYLYTAITRNRRHPHTWLRVEIQQYHA